MTSADDVVITGLGLVTPVGVGGDPVWRRLSDGKGGVRLIHDSAKRLDIIRTPCAAPDARLVMSNAFGFGGVNSSLGLEAVLGG